MSPRSPASDDVRTSLIYGGDEPGPQERLARENRRFFVDELRSPVQVGDLADAILSCSRSTFPVPTASRRRRRCPRFEFAVLLGADADQLEPARTTPERAPNVTLDSSHARALLETPLRGVRDVLG